LAGEERFGDSNDRASGLEAMGRRLVCEKKKDLDLSGADSQGGRRRAGQLGG